MQLIVRYIGFCLCYIPTNLVTGQFCSSWRSNKRNYSLDIRTLENRVGWNWKKVFFALVRHNNNKNKREKENVHLLTMAILLAIFWPKIAQNMAKTSSHYLCQGLRSCAHFTVKSKIYLQVQHVWKVKYFHTKTNILLGPWGPSRAPKGQNDTKMLHKSVQ